MWKVPNGFKKVSTIENGAHGMWVCTYIDKASGIEWKDYFNPKDNSSGIKARNVFSFIRRQSLLDKIVTKMKGQ